MTASECFRPTRSRGPAVPSAARATSRSRSCTALIASRNLPRSVVRNASSSTASSRSRIGSSATSGRSSHDRSRRLPIDVIVRSSSSSSDPVAPALRALEDLQVLQRRRIDQERVGALAVRDRAHVREVDLLRLAQVVDERARGGDGGRVAVEAEILRGRRRAVDRAASAARRRARTTSRRSASSADPRRRPAESRRRGAPLSPDGTTISRGLRTASSSASACMPSAPAYSAALNSPVERSRQRDADV